ncbi:TPA: hypothetical protein DEA21_03330, partial [Candidatus Uhrbacteria bacterium]|nr:hypothetical protein [Candidatus Uhrbacteria bacterium]
EFRNSQLQEFFSGLKPGKESEMLTATLAETTPAPSCQAAWSAFIAAATCLHRNGEGAYHPHTLPKDCPESWEGIRAAITAAFDPEWDEYNTQAIGVKEGLSPIIGWLEVQRLPVLILAYGAGRSFVQVAFLDNNQGAWMTTGVSSHPSESLDICETEQALISWKRRQCAVSGFCPKDDELTWLATLNAEVNRRVEEVAFFEVVRRNPDLGTEEEEEEEEDA